MMKQTLETTIEPVRKELKVNLSAEAAFRLFTEGLHKWWPLATHSVDNEKAESCIFEGHVGGRIYEVMNDGTQADWGRVLAWEPYDKVSFTWHPGRSADTEQEVTVTFRESSGSTLVELVHTGWEALGERAVKARNGYVNGWDYVLGKYMEAIEAN